FHVTGVQTCSLPICGRGQSTEVVSGLQATVPGHAVGDIQLLTVGAGDIQVKALGLVDPFLTTAGCLHDPARFHFKCGCVDGFQVGRDTVDALDGALVIYKVVDQYSVA